MAVSTPPFPLPLVSVTKPSPSSTVVVPDDYATVDAAAAAASAGWLIRVKAGTYSGFDIPSGDSGTSGNEIVLEAFGDGVATFNAQSRIQASHWIIDGGSNYEIQFKGNTNESLDNFVATGFPGWPTNITLWRCHLIESGGPYDVTQYTSQGSVVICDDFRCYNCVFEDSDGYAMYVTEGDNAILRNNYVKQIAGVGFQSNPRAPSGVCTNTHFFNNIFNNVGHNDSGTKRPAIAVLSSGDNYDVYIYNNFIYGRGHRGINKSSPINNTNLEMYIYNNTVYNLRSNGLIQGSAGTFTTVWRGNISQNNDANDVFDGPHTQDTNVLNTDTGPTWESTVETSADYLKLASSDTVAKDTGLALPVWGKTTKDIEDIQRPQGSDWDRGAREYQAAGGGLTIPIAHYHRHMAGLV